MVLKNSKYMRMCRKCGVIYRTTAKTSEVCQKCNMSKGKKGFEVKS
jgi:rRNA maturation endonuclease Nob1